MTPEEASRRFQKLVQMVNTDLALYIKDTVAHNASAAVALRVQETGKDFRGNSFKPYSTKPILTSGTTSKGKAIWNKMGSGAKDRDLGYSVRGRGLRWVTIKRQGKNIHLFELSGGYKQMRRLETLQTAYKDFSFSAMMWNHYGVKRTIKKAGEIEIIIGGKTQDSQDKIDWNSKREGVEIINISDQELEKLAKQIDQHLQKLINKAGLS